jgi:hypothetical protein
MSDDFLQELRTEVNGELGRLDAGSRWGVMISKAADEIERLRAENDMQRIVLKRALALVLEAARITRPALAKPEERSDD